MEFIIHQLELHRTIAAPENGSIAPDGTREIKCFRSLVGRNDLEPKKADHLAEGMQASEIPAGNYLFAQGILPESGSTTDREATFRDAAEAVWLEALWREVEFKNDRILVRILSEESKDIFQIFREAAKKVN